MIGVSDLRGYLLGNWTVVRLVVDRRGGARGRFAGEASFSPNGHDLLYREDGHLRLGGTRFPAGRTFDFRFPTPAEAEVAFDDGRPFHGLNLSAGAWRAEHLCGADRYVGNFTAEDTDAWTSVWDVVGPRKSQLLATRYRRTEVALSVVSPIG